MNKIKTTEPKVIWKLRCKLGEGTLWVKEHNSIYFVDIKKKKFFSLNIKNKKKKIYKVNKEIGFLAHIEGDVFILGLQGELRIQNIKTKKIIKKVPIEKNIKLNEEQGGKIKCGGKRHSFSNKGYYFPPTIIECDNHNLPTAENELFGPLLSVMKFDTEDEVISKMNDNQYGLSSGVYTSNLSRGMRVSKAIRAGITFVNTYRLISPSAPFGGIKDSGYGKEAGIDSIKDYTRVKTTWFYTSDEPTLDPFSMR
jgi:sugar lactone lactonase YvrE